LLLSGADVDDNNNAWECSPLHLAAGYGHPGAVESLINQNAEVNSLDSDGRTPLHAAAEQEGYFYPSEFWDVFYEAFISDDYGRFEEISMFISSAVNRGHDDLVKMYQSNQGAFDHEKSYRWLQCRIEKGFIETFIKLIGNGAIVDIKDAFGRTPLHLAAMTGQKENVLYLLENGAYKNVLDNCNQSPLHLVESPEVAEKLIGSGALLDIRDSEGRTPLHNAISSGNYELASLLIRSECEPAPKDRKGLTPLHLCAPEKKGVFRHIATCLIEGEADVDSKDDTGRTALFHAETKSMAEVLICNNADIMSSDYLGRTLLHTIAEKEEFKKNVQELLLFFMDNGLDVNAMDRFGKTPLLRARNHTCANILIQRGADVSAVDKSGRGTSWSKRIHPQ